MEGTGVTFEEMLAQVVEVLRRERRVSYRALRWRFGLDEEYLEDLKIELIQAKKLAIDEDNTILVWRGRPRRRLPVRRNASR